jgi:hypothetical protein
VKVLVACEFSGVVRDAFLDRGHSAFSCDLMPSERPTHPSNPHMPRHLQHDIELILGTCERAMGDGWQPDLMIAHPPCTYLASSGLHWNRRRPERQVQTEEALRFVQILLDANIPRIALENPIGCISTRIRKPDQIVQPWMFGDDASKATCLWLKNLPPLQPRNPLAGDRKTRRANQTPSGQNKLGPSPTRSADRSRTYPGFAAAMAEQWEDVA